MQIFKMKRKLLLICLVAALIFSVSVGVGAKNLPGADTEVNLNLRGVNLRDAFRALADVAGMNIITDSSVKGTVTLDLKNITFLEAVELLSKTNNLSYRIVGNTVLIASPESMKSGFAEKTTKVFKLKNSQPKEVKKSLNLLVDASDIRIDNRTKSLVVTTYKSKLTEIKKVIDKLDQSKKQIVLQARIEEISRNKMEKLGIEWGFQDVNLLANETKTNALKMFDGKIDNAEVNYSAVLNLLESNDKATLLANPQIATIDGKTANINIGDQVPIITTETDENGNIKTKVEFKDIGINLKITPRITNNNKVITQVRPEVSTVTKYVETTDGNRYPVISTRQAETNIRIQDGKTIAIGGLIKEEEIKRMSKIPLLGDLPMIGKLFQNETVDPSKKELIIFITPKIISDGGEITAEMKKDIKGEKNGKSSAEATKGKERENNKAKGGEKAEEISFNYKVKESDTFWSVSKLFGISFTRIMDYNGIEYMRPLEAGESLSIPITKNQYYQVKKKDTIQKIAVKYKVPPQDIKAINGIESLEEKAGQKIVLPVEVKPEDRPGNEVETKEESSNKEEESKETDSTDKQEESTEMNQATSKD